MKSGWHNVLSQPLMDPQKILLLLLHVKLDLMRNSVKALNKESRAVAFVNQKFSCISELILRTGIFESSQIREFMKYAKFDESMEDNERNAIVKNFLGDYRSSEYKYAIDEHLQNF